MHLLFNQGQCLIGLRVQKSLRGGKIIEIVTEIEEDVAEDAENVESAEITEETGVEEDFRTEAWKKRSQSNLQG